VGPLPADVLENLQRFVIDATSVFAKTALTGTLLSSLDLLSKSLRLRYQFEEAATTSERPSTDADTITEACCSAGHTSNLWRLLSRSE
jgi:hypothetical protein